MASATKEENDSQSKVKSESSMKEKTHNPDDFEKDKSASSETQENEVKSENTADEGENASDKPNSDAKLEKKEVESDTEEKNLNPEDKKETVKRKDQTKEKVKADENECEESNEESESEEEVGLLDRPVEVTGCRARKKVERLEIGFSTPKDKHELLEGKGKKLGECPRIEAQIQKMKINDLKPLHKMLFNRVGSGNEIKKNIRKFSGFPFDENSVEFSRKKASVEKLTLAILKQTCSILDIERGGTKDEIVARIMSFLLCPEDSGKKIPSSAKKPSKDKKKSSGKKVKADKKNKKEKSGDSDDNEEQEEEEDSEGEESMGGSDEENEDAASEEKSKSTGSKNKAKAEKGKKNEKPKASKRKADSQEESENQKQTKKANKMPSDEEITKLVKNILEGADLEEITMKKVIKQVSDAYPDFDLSHKKTFIKSTIKSIIS